MQRYGAGTLLEHGQAHERAVFWSPFLFVGVVSEQIGRATLSVAVYPSWMVERPTPRGWPSKPEGLEHVPDEILERIRLSRRQYRVEALQRVVEDALLYHQETSRDDPAHKARLAKREQALDSAITAYNEAMNPGPITEADVEFEKYISEKLKK